MTFDSVLAVFHPHPSATPGQFMLNPDEVELIMQCGGLMPKWLAAFEKYAPQTAVYWEPCCAHMFAGRPAWRILCPLYHCH